MLTKKTAQILQSNYGIVLQIQLSEIFHPGEGFQIPDFRCGGKHVLIKGDIPRVAFFPLVNHNPQ